MATKRKRTEGPAIEDWAAQKTIICDLYSKLDLPGLIKFMEVEYNFVASKNQYERKFKDWGLRKNLTSQDWEYVLLKKRKRDVAGKETQIVLYGLPISNERAKKQQSRYTLSDLNDMFSSNAPSPPAPQGLTVCTPPSIGAEYCPPRPSSPGALVITSPRTPRITSVSELLHINISNIPSAVFRNFFVSQDGLQVGLFHGRGVSRSVWSALRSQSSRIVESGRDFDAGLSMPRTSDESANHFISSSSTTTANAILSGFVGSSRHAKEQDITRYLEDHVLTQTKDDTKCRVEKLLGPSDADAFSEFVSIMVHKLSNADSFPDDRAILDWFASQNQSFLELFSTIKMPSVHASLEVLLRNATQYQHVAAFEAIFRADTEQMLFKGQRAHLMRDAVKVGSLEVVGKLLKEGFDVNILIFLDGFEAPSTMLGSASTVEMAQLLLEAGADIEAKSNEYLVPSSHLGYLTPCHHAAVKSNMVLLQLLLGAGAEFDPNLPTRVTIGCSIIGCSILENAIDRSDLSLVSLLIKKGALISGEILWTAMHENTEMFVFLLETEAVRKFLLADIDRWKFLVYAAWCGWGDLVIVLIEAGVNVNWSDERRFADKPLEEFWMEEQEDWYEDLWASVSPEASNPLSAAVQRGHTNVVEILITYSVDVNAPTFGFYGRTNVLEVAEDLGHHNIASILRQAGAMNLAPTQLPSSSYQNQRMLRAINGLDVQKVSKLIDVGVDPCNILDFDGFVDAHSTSSVLRDTLGEEIKEVDYYDCNEVAIVMSEEELQVAREFLRLYRRASADKINGTGPRNGLSAIQVAIDIADLGMLEAMILGGVSLVASLQHDRYPAPHPCLHYAVIRAIVAEDHKVVIERYRESASAAGTSYRKLDSSSNPNARIAVVQMLLKYGAQVNNRTVEDSALQIAASSRTNGLVRLLLAAGADVDPPSSSPSPLRSALRAGKIDEARLLLQYGALVDTRTWYEGSGVSRTPLQDAARSGARREVLEILELLLEYGANVNAPALGEGGRAALQAAAEQGTLEVVKFLLKNGADVNAPPAEEVGRTALQAAASGGEIEMVQLFLEQGADVNAPPARTSGITALQGAAIKGHLKIVYMLLQRGAEPNAPGAIYRGRTALEGAAERGRLDTVQLLLDNKAVPSESAVKFAEKEGHFVIADIIEERLKNDRQDVIMPPPRTKKSHSTRGSKPGGGSAMGQTTKNSTELGNVEDKAVVMDSLPQNLMFEIDDDNSLESRPSLHSRQILSSPYQIPHSPLAEEEMVWKW